MRIRRMSVGTLALAIPAVLVFSFLPGHLFSALRQPSTLPQQTQPSTGRLLRTTTILVQLSVIATDKKGEPVEDLTTADFVLLDNGIPQQIRIFKKETNQLPARPPGPLPPDTYTNQFSAAGSVPPSVTMLLLDGLNTALADQSTAQQAVIKFLQQIQPQDHIAIYTLGRDLHVLQDLTSDSEKLVAAVSEYSGRTNMDLDASTPTQLQTGDDSMDALLQDAFQREANMYIQDRVRITVDALIAIADYAAALPGRKNLLWVSGSFPFSVGYEDLATITQMINDPKQEANLSGQQQMFAEDIERAARALNDANIAVYPVDSRGLIGPNMNTAKGTSKNPGFGALNSGSQGGDLMGPGAGRAGSHSGAARLGAAATPRNPTRNSMAKSPANPITNPDNTTFETMDALAEGTGGKAFYNSNDLSSSLRTVIEDSRMTYELAYNPSDVKWDGSFHTVTVQIKRPDVTVRARKGYFALPEPAPSAQSLRAIVTSAVGSPLDSTGLGLAVRMTAEAQENMAAAQENVAAALPRGPGAATTAMIFFDPRVIKLEPNAGHFNGNVAIVLAQLDQKELVVHADQQVIPLSFDSKQYQQFLKQQVALTQQINLLPNAERLRVVLCDGTTGRVGSVTVPLAKYQPSKPPAN